MNLARREKAALALGGGLLLVLLTVQFVVMPVIDHGHTLQRRVTAREQSLAEMRQLYRQYLELNENSQDVQVLIDNRPADFSLFSFLEEAADRSLLKANIKYMKPSQVLSSGAGAEAMVEMKLEKISLSQLTAFLALVERTENLVTVRRMAIQHSAQGEAIWDATFTISTVLKG